MCHGCVSRALYYSQPRPVGYLWAPRWTDTASAIVAGDQIAHTALNRYDIGMNRSRHARRIQPFLVVAIVSLLTELAPSTVRAAVAPPAPNAPLRVHFISGSKEYASEPSLKRFKEELERRYDVTVTASWGQDGGVSLENLQDLERAEVLLLFARRMKLPEGQMKLIRAH